MVPLGFLQGPKVCSDGSALNPYIRKGGRGVIRGSMRALRGRQWWIVLSFSVASAPKIFKQHFSTLFPGIYKRLKEVHRQIILGTVH